MIAQTGKADAMKSFLLAATNQQGPQRLNRQHAAGGSLKASARMDSKWPETSEIPGLSAPPKYSLRNPKYHLTETVRPLIEVHWGVQVAQFPVQG